MAAQMPGAKTRALIEWAPLSSEPPRITGFPMMTSSPSTSTASEPASENKITDLCVQHYALAAAGAQRRGQMGCSVIQPLFNNRPP